MGGDGDDSENDDNHINDYIKQLKKEWVKSSRLARLTMHVTC